MKKILCLSLVLMGALLSTHAFAGHSEAFDAKTVAKLETYLAECNGPGQDPKPKMAELATYLGERGMKDAKIECGVSHYGETEPMLTLKSADGATYFVNFKTKGKSVRVKEIVEDAQTAAGMKRNVVWPTPKKAK